MKIFIAVLFVCSILMVTPGFSAVMEDYCVIPPYVVTDLKPNIMLFMDNSASMYDLEYVDEGSATRDPQYCYDQTYRNDRTYYGYFDPSETYEYDLVNNNFKVSSLSLSGCTKTISNVLCINLNTAVTPAQLTAFRAKGNYLNWLVTSKFDAQKGVLTGGKYVDRVCSNSDITSCLVNADCPSGGTCDDVANFLQAESRGCVGRKFLKEPLTANFAEYTPPALDPNTSLGMTFGIRGPVNEESPTSPSQGGQTYIDLFVGDYQQGLCQAAIDAFEEGHDPATIKKAVDDCLSATTSPSAHCSLDPARTCSRDSDCILAPAGVCSGAPKTCTAGDPGKIGKSCKKSADCNWNVGPCVSGTATTESKEKVVFNQTIQACWALTSKGVPISTDEVNTVRNHCTDIYNENFMCDGGAKDGKVCSVAADCPGGSCISGPDAIRPGNPSYLCSTSYAGACFTKPSPVPAPPAEWPDVWNGCFGGNCGDACIIERHTAFCGAIEIPPVVDPTDDPSITQEYINLPAIISDIGVEAQLGQPIKTLAVKLRYDGFCSVTTGTACINDAGCPSGEHCTPYGLLQDFDGQIRFGMAAFNYNGSAAECNNLSAFKCPKICSTSTDISCTSNLDCPSGETCTDTAAGSTNKDAVQVFSHIKSVCSVSLNVCNLDSDCPGNETCRPYSGSHRAGLISQIDQMRATTWTPYSEGFFDLLGYYTQNVTAGATPYRLYAADFSLPPFEPNPVQGICQDNNIVLISDGMSTTDQKAAVMNFVAANPVPGGQTTTVASASWDVTPRFFGSKNLDDLAYYGQTASLMNPVSAAKPIRSVTTSVLYSGSACDLKDAAGNCTTTDEAVPEKLMQLTASHGGGVYKHVTKPEEFRSALSDILQALLKRASAGAAASVLASGEGYGANLVQAVFYPKRKFSLSSASGVDVSSEIRWTGRLSNFWYYVDPFFKGSSIYEDNLTPKVLDLRNDNQITLRYDPDQEQTVGRQSKDTNGDGVVDSYIGEVPFEQLRSLWEAGTALLKRDSSVESEKRKIYTTINGSTMLAGNFSGDSRNGDSDNAGTLQSYLDPTDLNKDGAVDSSDARMLIQYVHGENDFASYGLRSRTVPVDLNGNGQYDAGENKIWKLGDILNSTPRISSRINLNRYYDVYKDATYLAFTSKNTNAEDYGKRGMVFAGGNDGMLHAFKLGSLEMSWTGQNQYEKARLMPLAGTDFGREMWAFIPKNVLPYLKYTADGTYCHVYSVDLTPYIFDASIGGLATEDKPAAGSSWRTVLIGGLRYGGGCKDPADSNGDGVADDCTTDTNGDGIVNNHDCVLTPASGKGYSSYFALDVTDQYHPTLLWEFSHPELGFSTTGPAIVRVGDKMKNGDWFVVLGSGPTGPIDKMSHQFLGHSDQNLQLFILDLKTGTLLDKRNTGITNAFAGSILNATFDSDVDYQDDVVYIGYTKKVLGGEWTNGGVLRLMTKESASVANWDDSIVIDNTGAVTSAVTRLQDNKNHNLWLFFGTGRYFYEIEDRVDDSDSQRRLYGVKEPCFDAANALLPACTDAVSAALDDMTATPNATPDAIGDGGWFISLDGTGSFQYNEEGTLVPRKYRAERVITDPLAASTGIVFFTTYKPYNEICSYGGKTFVWAVKYNTAGSAGSLLRGVGLLQVSTGSIEQIDLKEAFKQDPLKNPDSRGNRRSAAMEGVPPTNQGLSIMSTPAPVKRILHVRER